MAQNQPQTLEEAREMLLQASEREQQLQHTIDTLTAENAEKVTEISKLQTLNQQLFLRIPQGEEEEEPELEPVETPEEFAKRMKGMIIR